MKAITLSIQQICLYAGLLSLSIPLVAHATPVLSNPSMFLIAQANSRSAQAFQSRELGFRIEVPQNYTIDRSQERQGIITFRNEATPAAVGSDQPAPAVPTENQTAAVTGDEPQVSPSDKIQVRTFDNPKRLSAADWAKQNDAQSFLSARQSEIQQRRFAGQPAISYSWCSNTVCGDNIVLPSRDRRRIIVLSALYDFPGDSVRWDFQRIAGQFRFVQ